MNNLRILLPLLLILLASGAINSTDLPCDSNYVKGHIIILAQKDGDLGLIAMKNPNDTKKDFKAIPYVWDAAYSLYDVVYFKVKKENKVLWVTGKIEVNKPDDNKMCTELTALFKSLQISFPKPKGDHTSGHISGHPALKVAPAGSEPPDACVYIPSLEKDYKLYMIEEDNNGSCDSFLYWLPIWKKGTEIHYQRSKNEHLGIPIAHQISHRENYAKWYHPHNHRVEVGKPKPGKCQ